MDAVDLIGWMLAALSIAAIVWMVFERPRDGTVRSPRLAQRALATCSTTPTWT